MVDEPAPEEVVDLLIKRYDILRLFMDEPHSRADLQDRLDFSRATIYRVTSRLEDLHIIEAIDDTYRLTKFGQQVVNRHRDYFSAIRKDCQIEQFLSSVPTSLPFDSPVLDGAEVFFRTSGAAETAIHQNKLVIENAQRVRKVFDSMMSDYFQVHLEPTKHHGQEVEVVIPEKLVETALNIYEEELRELAATNNFELFTTTEPIEFSTTIAETDQNTHTILFVHTNGSVECAARNDTEPARAWAESRYEWYRQHAELVCLNE